MTGPPLARAVGWLVCCTAPFASALAAAADGPDHPSTVDRRAVIKYASPKEATGVPLEFRRQLMRDGCRIPQPATKGSAWVAGIENAIVGHFARAGQQDAAVVCSRRGVSRVVVRWGGPARCPPLPDRWIDAATVGVTDGGDAGFLLAIDPIPPTDIEAYGTVDEAPSPERREHDGLDLVELTKGMSGVRYCDRGRWIDLPGMD